MFSKNLSNTLNLRLRTILSNEILLVQKINFYVSLNPNYSTQVSVLRVVAVTVFVVYNHYIGQVVIGISIHNER